jgi:hypothetical protein
MAQGKYHLTKNGDGVAICKAQKGNCPLGGEHFSTSEDAFKHLESKLSADHGSFLRGKKKDYTDVPGASYKMESTRLLESDADGKQVRDALRDENPSWSGPQVHTVYQQMVKKQAGTQPGSKPTPPPVDSKMIMNKYEAASAERETAIIERRELNSNILSENALRGAQEGRAYYMDYSSSRYVRKVEGINPSGKTYFTESSDQKARKLAAGQKVELATLDLEKAQTEVEEAGLGHMLPDKGNVLRVRTQAQKWLVEKELKGQISDGMWENATPQNHWQAWSDADVVVDPQNVGRNFYAAKDNYQLNSKDLVSIVGDEMTETVASKTENAYNDKELAADLKDLRTIFKTQRSRLAEPV